MLDSEGALTYHGRTSASQLQNLYLSIESSQNDLDTEIRSHYFLTKILLNPHSYHVLQTQNDLILSDLP